MSAHAPAEIIPSAVDVRHLTVQRDLSLEVNHGSHQLVRVVRGSGTIAVSQVFINAQPGTAVIIRAGALFGFRSEASEGMELDIKYQPPYDATFVSPENRRLSHAARQALQKQAEGLDMNVQLALLTRQLGINDRFAGRIIGDRLFPLDFGVGLDPAEDQVVEPSPPPEVWGILK